MWDCIKCGCMAIAGSLDFCPMCRKEREDMPKATAGGASNGYDPQAEEPEAPATQPEAEPDVAAEAPVTEDAPAPTPISGPARAAAARAAAPAPAVESAEEPGQE